MIVITCMGYSKVQYHGTMRGQTVILFLGFLQNYVVPYLTQYHLVLYQSLVWCYGSLLCDPLYPTESRRAPNLYTTHSWTCGTSDFTITRFNKRHFKGQNRRVNIVSTRTRVKVLNTRIQDQLLIIFLDRTRWDDGKTGRESPGWGDSWFPSLVLWRRPWRGAF